MDLVNLALVQKAVRDAHVDHIGPPGPKGDKGDKGDPLTWNDLTEEQKASLKGEKGDTGPQGPAGAGGYTPVKGIDYFTESDKTELVNAVLAMLPVAEGVSF